MINSPEYWRIILAVEKVIIRHEFEILQKDLSVLVNDSPFMALYAAARLTSFGASASARLKNIKFGAQENKAASQSRVLVVRGLDKNCVITGSNLKKMLEGIDSVTIS